MSLSHSIVVEDGLLNKIMLMRLFRIFLVQKSLNFLLFQA